MMRRDRRHARSAGFTLTEVLVGIAIFAIIFVAALMIYDRSNRVFKTSMELSDMQQNTRVSFEKMVADLRMAGFDYDRDGYPSGENVYQQPDEQLEFIHPHAITIRTNVDYESDAENDNGREEPYEPLTGEFPIVTTANEEIITYALVSDNGANSDSISFYADVAKPRQTFPGGASETQVTISGVDLCDDGAGCADPPYTLYRITLDDSGAAVKTPVADNIRSLSFDYFSDALSLNPVTPNGGAGQYTVSGTGNTTTATANTERGVRTSVQSIRMRLVGMTDVASNGFVSPEENSLPTAEQVASAKEYRQYVLESTIVPRNLGRRGMQEPSVKPPGAPKVTAVCAEGCGVVRVEWSAPPEGTVDGYAIIYDTSQSGNYGSTPVDAGNKLFGYVYGLNPGTNYYFMVVAKNSYGSERSINNMGPVDPINYTKPKAPVMTGATGDSAGTTPALQNEIKIAFSVPGENVTGSVDSCGNGATEVGSDREIIDHSGFIIERSTDDTFPPADTVEVFNGGLSATGAPELLSDLTATWTDTNVLVNCQTYYYRVRIKENCYSDAAYNNGGNVNLSLSDWSNVIDASANASAKPVAPINVTITTLSACDYPQIGECKVELLWDRVTKDVDGNDILVDEYVVRRFDYVNGVESSTYEEFIIPDTDPSSSDPLLWINETAADPTLVPPANPGDRYHYYVAARQCDAAAYMSDFSSPVTKFPCAVVAAGVPSPLPIQGDGQSSPYLIYSSNASMKLTANVGIQQATMSIYEAGTGALVTDSTTNPLLVSHTVGDPEATFNIPLSATSVYQAVMTMIDQSGCGTTIIRYFQASVTGCCLEPFKTVTLTANNDSVLAVSGNTVKVTLDNQCTEDVIFDRIRIHWNSAANSFGDLQSITYPNGTVTTPLAGTLKDGLNADLTDGSAVITPPDAAKAVVPGSGTYTITLTFGKSSGTTADITNFCLRDSDANTCKVVQGPNATFSQCTFP